MDIKNSSMQDLAEIQREVELRGEYSTRDAIEEVWGERTPYFGEWPERVDERILEIPEKWIQSTCVLCSTGCGMDIGVKENRIVGVRGRAVDRVNKGRLGPKGMNGWEANHSPNRLTTPFIRKDGKLEPATWDEAMELIVSKTKEIQSKYTGDAIGFYNSGQLFLEEYYTLSIMGDAGIGTNHMDGNTRLCTATAAVALMESFGTDGDPGSYTDLDVTDTILHVGHNPAFTQTVLWNRILDRLEGPNPPTLIVIDPRLTDTAKKAAIHLRPRLGTNLALLNGLLNQIIETGNLDQYFIHQHTVGFEKLKEVVNNYPIGKVSEITGVPPNLIREAAEVLGHTKTLVSTVLQGVYQSWQASASAIQVNNIHLVRGLLGKEGSTVFQMNGQPTAQNTRECGANGELVAFLNWNNPDHVAHLARHWNVRPEDIPHVKPPTSVMEIFRLAEEGSIRMLWIIATNPAVSLPKTRKSSGP
jgi:anaerobic selenocysteine-containing dehydrogenase